MYNNFSEIEKSILEMGKIFRVAAAGANSRHVLEALVHAVEKNIIHATLIGNEPQTRKLLEEMGARAEDFHFCHMEDETLAAQMACAMVSQGEADIPLKGTVSTSSFMRAVLNKDYGLTVAGKLLSQATLFEWSGRMMILSDCAINVSPSFEDKCKIIDNAVALARKVGICCPKTAILCPLEKLNPVIESTVHASMLVEANKNGHIKNCTVDGPLALDNAISLEAAQRKNIVSPVAGQADILIVPDLDAGNILTKSLTYFAGLKTAGTVLGTRSPVIMCSRTDSVEDKYNSILAAIMPSLIPD